MKYAQAPTLQAGPSTAKVVIIRPQRAGQSNRLAVTFWDSTQPVGQFYGGQAMAVELAPGKHHFVALSSNRDVVEADLVAGKTYYLYLWFTDYLAASTIHINPLYPAHKHWNDKERWLQRCRWIELIPQNAALLKQRHGQQVSSALAEFDPAGENATRAIQANYGV